MKKVAICLLLFAILIIFASCKPDNSSNSNNEGNADSSAPSVVDGAIWSPGAKIQLVVGESPDWNSADFIMALGDIIGVVPEYSVTSGSHPHWHHLHTLCSQFLCQPVSGVVWSMLSQ